MAALASVASSSSIIKSRSEPTKDALKLEEEEAAALEEEETVDDEGAEITGVVAEDEDEVEAETEEEEVAAILVDVEMT